MRSNRGHVFGTIVGLFLVLTGFVLGTALMASSATSPATADLNVSQQAVPLSSTEQLFAHVYETVSPSVVAISVTSLNTASSGSGFVIDTDGHIVTNYHVVEGAQSIEVNFFDGTITRAEVVGVDIDSDLAVIRVDLTADRLVPITFGPSDDLVVGQQVLAIGSPFGQRWTMTAGIVSALDRAIEGFTAFRIGGVIQTDAPINPGNSGGPLLNLNGEVVGVNSQIRSDTRANSGIGFAVPSDLTARVAREIIENGEVDYSYIGIGGRDLTLALSEVLNLANDVRGVVLETIENGSPAARAGLKPGTALGNNRLDLRTADIVVGIDGQNVMGFDGLISYLAKYTVPGDTVTLDVLRDGNVIQIPITLTSRPSR